GSSWSPWSWAWPSDTTASRSREGSLRRCRRHSGRQAKVGEDDREHDVRRRAAPASPAGRPVPAGARRPDPLQQGLPEQGGDRRGAEVTPADALDRLLRLLDVPGEAIPSHVDDRAMLYRNRLRGRSMLIVLDNAGSANQVLPLLPAEPRCRVLITSRHRLPAL